MIAFCFFGGDTAHGKDTLGDFEKEVEESDDDDDYDDDDLDFDEDGFDALFAGLAATSDHFADRRPGGLSAPLLRLETGYQTLTDADVDGFTVRSEIVWSFFGVGAEFLRYREGDPYQKFEFGTTETLLRIAPGERLRFSIANGIRILEGKNKHTAYQAGFSIGLYPHDWWGLEFDARFADVGKDGMADYRVGGLLRIPRFRFVALRIGYRAIVAGNETLEGAEIGAVVTW